MSDVTQLLSEYIPGTLQITKLSATRFRLEGNWSTNIRSTDHLQLIGEALEIAAASDDIFKTKFKAMFEEYIALADNWEV